MTKIKKFISTGIPINVCNLDCSYCYVKKYSPDMKERRGQTEFTYDIELLRKALSYDRLGGACLFNLVGDGETLFSKELLPVTRILLENGHFVFITTNGTITNLLEEFLFIPDEQREQLGFKFSYHSSELKRTGLLETYYSNIKMMRENGFSVYVEMVPSDEMIDDIDEIKASVYEATGAMCHITLPRIDIEDDKGLLSEYTLDEFVEKWSVFESPLLKFKKTIQGVKIKEFCYAGDWSYVLDLKNGNLKQCLNSNYSSNIFKDIDKPLPRLAIGNNCRDPYCWCGHIFLTLGTVPELHTPTYDTMRNRKCSDGSEWLRPEMKHMMSQKLYDNNREYGKWEKLWCNTKNKYHMIIKAIKKKIKKMITR